MSRYTGPQQRGAERQLRDERRREAETRQGAERKRDARRRAEQQAPPRPLTDREREELAAALLTIEAGRILADVRAQVAAPTTETGA